MYTIEGTLTGDAASGKAYLERSVYLSDSVVVDSTVVQNGSFTFFQEKWSVRDFIM